MDPALYRATYNEFFDAAVEQARKLGHVLPPNAGGALGTRSSQRVSLDDLTPK
jgi:hypothetical protein